MKQPYVALLRGINVGGNHKVSMSRLVEVFEGLGFVEVRTYINSGNVVFQSQKKPDEREISNKLKNVFWI